MGKHTSKRPWPLSVKRRILHGQKVKRNNIVVIPNTKETIHTYRYEDCSSFVGTRFELDRGQADRLCTSMTTFIYRENEMNKV